MPHPRMAPISICIVVAGPMIMPCPTYAGDGLRVHSQFVAKDVPKIGMSLSCGMKYETSVCCALVSIDCDVS